MTRWSRSAAAKQGSTTDAPVTATDAPTARWLCSTESPTGPGEAEATFLPPLPFDVEVTVLVAGYEGEAGDYRLTIEFLEASSSFDPARYPDIQRYEDEFLDSIDYETHYAPFFDGEFYEP